MQTINPEIRHVANLHWLAFLLTGRRQVRVDLSAESDWGSGNHGPSFANWLLAWSRRVVIAKALTAIRDELAASARRLDSRRLKLPPVPARDWALDEDTTKVHLERALLDIDVFPRAALLLVFFEGIRIQDAATLLDASPELLKKAQAAGLAQLTSNLARMQGWVSSTTSQILTGETQYA